MKGTNITNMDDFHTPVYTYDGIPRRPMRGEENYENNLLTYFVYRYIKGTIERETIGHSHWDTVDDLLAADRSGSVQFIPRASKLVRGVRISGIDLRDCPSDVQRYMGGAVGWLFSVGGYAVLFRFPNTLRPAL